MSAPKTRSVRIGAAFHQYPLKERAIGRKAIGLPAFLVFRALAVAAGNAGFASFIVGMLSRAVAPRLTPVVASLPSFAFTLAAALIPSSLAASFLMPNRTALVRDVRGEDEPPLAPQVALLLVVLCGLAMLQVPGVLSWWRAERAVLQGALPERPDDLGFNYIPMAIAYGLPVVAALTIALFVITALLPRAYEVVHPGTAETIAKFVPRGADWEIEDAHGNIAARILSNRGTFDFVKYRAFVGETEVCKFKWTLAGFSTSAAQSKSSSPTLLRRRRTWTEG